jgi:predicted RNase H-like HicB family nuclease
MATVAVGEKFTVIHAGVEYEFEVAEEGGYVASVPLYPSALSQGDTFEEALANVSDALVECLAAARDLGLEIPPELEGVVKEAPVGGSAG